MSERSVEEIEAELREVNARRAGLQRELFAARGAQAGIALGDLVISTGTRHTGVEYLVTEIDFWGRGAVSLKGRRLLKGGGYHAVPSYIGTSWRKKEESE